MLLSLRLERPQENQLTENFRICGINSLTVVGFTASLSEQLINKSLFITEERQPLESAGRPDTRKARALVASTPQHATQLTELLYIYTVAASNSPNVRLFRQR